MQTLTTAPIELKKLFIGKLHSIFLLDTLDMVDIQASFEALFTVYNVRLKSLEDLLEKRIEELAMAEDIDYKKDAMINNALFHEMKIDAIYQALGDTDTVEEYFYESINSRAHRNPQLFEKECFWFIDFSTFKGII